MYQEVAPKVEQTSFPKGNHRSVTFKHNKNLDKRSFFAKKPKNLLDKLVKAFSKDLENVIKTQESIQQGLSKTDEQMKKVKKGFTDSANLLLLHKGFARHLQQLRTDRHPVISKTQNVVKMQKKYNHYIESVDALRDTVSKLKVQSIKFKEGIGKWKQQQKISTHLLKEFLNNNELNSPSDDDDCIEASSSAPSDADYENYDDYCDDWDPIINSPSPDHRCHFVHHERKCPIKMHHPVCPIQIPKKVINKRHNASRKRDVPMETPMLNENSMLAKKSNEMQNTLQNHKNKKQSIDERIAHLRQEIRSLIRQDVHYDTIGGAEVELNSLITEGAWVEKEIERVTKQIDKIRKRQGFTRIARAFMATAIHLDDPFQITTSVIQPTRSKDAMTATNIKIDNPFEVPMDEPYGNVLYSNNSELQEDHKKLQTATAQLQDELGKIKAELTQIYANLNDIEKTPRASTSTNTDFIFPHTASTNGIQDLLSLVDPPTKPVDIFDRLDNVTDATLQAKLAKELIKLANSYKIPELTFDVQASKGRFNFSTWYSKMQTILSMFPQTALIVRDPNTISFYPNINDIGNKALFLLIGAKVDAYFQHAIRHFAGHGDKALVFIKSQCANICTEDKVHFHHAFTTLRIKENESATAFLKRFIFAKTEAESSGNSYSEHELVSFALNGLNYSKNPKYDTALQLYRLEREHG